MGSLTLQTSSDFSFRASAPKDIDLELFEITYVQCGDVELERKIDEKIDQFIDKVEKHPNKKNQICLSFYEVKNKQATWFSNKVERLHWEQWYINLNVTQNPKGHSGKSHLPKVEVNPGDTAAEARRARRTALECSLRDILFQIIRFVNEKRDHVPPIPNLDGVSFPYEITISRFCFWDGHVQENAPNWASYNAQLISKAFELVRFL
ncbi:UNVERIFIED_CONTAM: Autophagy-related protein [Sesamum calycinum]|uniref:Autophagy-related protein 101 n=1 Tax=Sesamum calycinum TaxID=2727403 RepID=A0AAW2SW70_9LAMI